MKHLHIRRLAATGAGLALAATGMAVSMAPAQADSAPLDYTCEVPLLGAQTFITTMSAPATVPVGGNVQLDAAVEVPEGLVDSLRTLLQGESVEGDALAQGLANETPVEVPLNLPKTDVPESGSMTVLASGGTALPAVVPVGTELALVAGDYTVNLTVNKTDGTSVGPLAVPCALDAEQDNAIGDVTVVKAKSTTKVQKVKGKKKKAVVKVKVKSETSVKATGKVKVTLKGPKKVTKKVKVNKKGVAKVTVKKLKKGKYKVNAKYLGDKNVKASKGKAKGKVKVK